MHMISRCKAIFEGFLVPGGKKPTRAVDQMATPSAGCLVHKGEKRDFEAKQDGCQQMSKINNEGRKRGSRSRS